MTRFTLDHPADDPHRPRLSGRLNWLRAGILGGNDGIVSVASIVVGVAAATNVTGAILTAGAAALVGGAVSMALGEYVSVSSQSDTEHTVIALQRRDLETMPRDELAELVHLYEARGLSPETARTVARELTDHDPLAAHLEVEFGIDQADLVSPWHAALASGIAFTIGGLLPVLAMLASAGIRIPLTFVVALVALPATGAIGARIGGSPVAPAAIRVLVGGAVALTATFLIGNALGTIRLV
jgi:VIT1/CCC1 family predicted Fe2+/Mn2+ transporter